MAYLYRHIRPDKNLPFYIGVGLDSEGKYRRANSKVNRNSYWYNIVNKCGYEIEIIIDNIEWDEALLKEKEFIKIYDPCLEKFYPYLLFLKFQVDG